MTPKVTIRELRDEKAAELVKAKLEELCELVNRFPDLVFQYQMSQTPMQIVRLEVYRRVLVHPPQAAQTPQ